MNKKTILLTGATGYLGGNVLKQLVENINYRIIILKRSFSNTIRIQESIDKTISYNLDKILLEDIFKKHKIDTILHCATNYGRKNINPLEVIEANLILPVKLLELGKNYGVNCFINTDTILDKRVNHYSLSKRQFKDWLYSYRNDLVCVNVALEHFYGPFDDKTKFVSFLVDSLIRQVDNIDLTKGEQKRDFIYIDDVVSAFLKIIDHSINLKNNFFNFEIGSDKTVSIKDLASMMKKIVGNTGTFLNFGALPYRENEVMESIVDITEIKKLGWQTQYSLQEGLSKMIEQELQDYNIHI